MLGSNPQRSGKGVCSENGPPVWYAYGLHRDAYDLHGEFGSGKAAKGSKKMDKNTPLTL